MHVRFTPKVPNRLLLRKYLTCGRVIVAGFVFFGLDVMSESKKKMFMLYHKGLGAAAALLGAAAILTGL